MRDEVTFVAKPVPGYLENPFAKAIPDPSDGLGGGHRMTVGEHELEKEPVLTSIAEPVSVGGIDARGVEKREEHLCGLMACERKVMYHLIEAWAKFLKLPNLDSDALQVFRRAIHDCQALLALRVVGRKFEGWR